MKSDLKLKKRYIYIYIERERYLLSGGGVVWYRVIIVSALSLSLRDKDRLRDREIERA